MALDKVKFAVWRVPSLNLVVTCRFTSVDQAIHFHREIYDGRLYEVPQGELRPAIEWRRLPDWMTENLVAPFKVQYSNDILSVATIPQSTTVPPTILARPTEKAELFYENYYKMEGESEFLKIFILTIGEQQPVAIFEPNSFTLASVTDCEGFLVVTLMGRHFIITVDSEARKNNLNDTFSHFTEYKGYCPPEVKSHLDYLSTVMYPNN